METTIKFQDKDNKKEQIKFCINSNSNYNTIIIDTEDKQNLIYLTNNDWVALTKFLNEYAKGNDNGNCNI